MVVTILTSEANIGRKMVAVATLEVNSVKVVIKIQTLITIAKLGMASRLASCEPTHLDRPDTWSENRKQNISISGDLCAKC